MVKKEGIILIFISCIIIQSSFVIAAIGITPASIHTDFKPGEKFLVDFQVLYHDAPYELDVVAKGDFAEYVKFDKTRLKAGESTFTAYIDLPLEAEKPGENLLSIQVIEDTSSGGGVGSRLGVGSRVYIRVPYPGIYLEGNSFDAPDSNVGEPINFSAIVNNFGKEQASAQAIIQIYSENKKIDEFDLGYQLIEPDNSFVFSKLVEGGHYRAGIYNATLYVEYGGKKPIVLTDSFRVGRLFVDVVDFTKEFNKSKISNFDIEVESKWNSDIDNIYAEVEISNKSGVVDSFKTPSVYLVRWEKATLKGFFNAEGVEEGKYKAMIKVFYNGEVTEKEVNIKVVDPEGGLFSSLDKTLIIIGIIVIVFILVFFIGFIIMYNMLKKRLITKNR